MICNYCRTENIARAMTCAVCHAGLSRYTFVSLREHATYAHPQVLETVRVLRPKHLPILYHPDYHTAKSEPSAEHREPIENTDSEQSAETNRPREVVDDKSDAPSQEQHSEDFESIESESHPEESIAQASKAMETKDTQNLEGPLGDVVKTAVARFAEGARAANVMAPAEHEEGHAEVPLTSIVETEPLTIGEDEDSEEIIDHILDELLDEGEGEQEDVDRNISSKEDRDRFTVDEPEELDKVDDESMPPSLLSEDLLSQEAPVDELVEAAVDELLEEGDAFTRVATAQNSILPASIEGAAEETEKIDVPPMVSLPQPDAPLALFDAADSAATGSRPIDPWDSEQRWSDAGRVDEKTEQDSSITSEPLSSEVHDGEAGALEEDFSWEPRLEAPVEPQGGEEQDESLAEVAKSDDGDSPASETERLSTDAISEILPRAAQTERFDPWAENAEAMEKTALRGDDPETEERATETDVEEDNEAPAGDGISDSIDDALDALIENDSDVPAVAEEGGDGSSEQNLDEGPREHRLEDASVPSQYESPDESHKGAEVLDESSKRDVSELEEDHDDIENVEPSVGTSSRAQAIDPWASEQNEFDLEQQLADAEAQAKGLEDTEQETLAAEQTLDKENLVPDIATPKEEKEQESTSEAISEQPIAQPSDTVSTTDEPLVQPVGVQVGEEDEEHPLEKQAEQESAITLGELAADEAPETKDVHLGALADFKESEESVDRGFSARLMLEDISRAQKTEVPPSRDEDIERHEGGTEPEHGVETATQKPEEESGFNEAAPPDATAMSRTGSSVDAAAEELGPEENSVAQSALNIKDLEVDPNSPEGQGAVSISEPSHQQGLGLEKVVIGSEQPHSTAADEHSSSHMPANETLHVGDAEEQPKEHIGLDTGVASESEDNSKVAQVPAVDDALSPEIEHDDENPQFGQAVSLVVENVSRASRVTGVTENSFVASEQSALDDYLGAGQLRETNVAFMMTRQGGGSEETSQMETNVYALASADVPVMPPENGIELSWSESNEKMSPPPAGSRVSRFFSRLKDSPSESPSMVVGEDISVESPDIGGYQELHLVEESIPQVKWPMLRLIGAGVSDFLIALLPSVALLLVMGVDESKMAIRHPTFLDFMIEAIILPSGGASGVARQAAFFLCFILVSALHQGLLLPVFGRTAGCFLFDLEYADESTGKYPSTFASIARGGVGAVTILLFGIGPFYGLWIDPRHRTISDLMANTCLRAPSRREE